QGGEDAGLGSAVRRAVLLCGSRDTFVLLSEVRFCFGAASAITRRRWRSRRASGRPAAVRDGPGLRPLAVGDLLGRGPGDAIAEFDDFLLVGLEFDLPGEQPALVV